MSAAPAIDAPSGDDALAHEFHRIFSGLRRSYGKYIVSRNAAPDASGKIKGQAVTISEAATPELWARLGPLSLAQWEDHLSGKMPLGVVPIPSELRRRLIDAKKALDAAPRDRTRLGRQELNAELLDDVPGALWERDTIEACRVEKTPALRRIVVAIDPATTSGEDADESGIVVAGAGEDGHGYVLEDLSGRYAPIEWARIAVSAYRRHQADRIIAETNNGGEMVEATVRMVDPNVSYKSVHASRGKFTRAEPVSALYEQGRVHHVGTLPILEDQMAAFTPDLDRERSKSSPDRVDALVWAFTELMVEGTAQAWIDHYGAMAAAANAPSPLPVAGDALPWRSKLPSPLSAGNELTNLYNETLEATMRGTLNRNCKKCGKPMIPGETRITDGVDVWHLGCA
jgi:predicted phage terminase large subunit-like protein